MKFVAVLCSLVAAVAAQRAFIGEPQSSDTWTAGHDELVSVVKPVRHPLLYITATIFRFLRKQTGCINGLNGSRYCHYSQALHTEPL